MPQGYQSDVQFGEASRHSNVGQQYADPAASEGQFGGVGSQQAPRQLQAKQGRQSQQAYQQPQFQQESQFQQPQFQQKSQVAQPQPQQQPQYQQPGIQSAGLEPQTQFAGTGVQTVESAQAHPSAQAGQQLQRQPQQQPQQLQRQPQQMLSRLSQGMAPQQRAIPQSATGQSGFVQQASPQSIQPSIATQRQQGAAGLAATQKWGHQQAPTQQAPVQSRAIKQVPTQQAPVQSRAIQAPTQQAPMQQGGQQLSAGGIQQPLGQTALQPSAATQAGMDPRLLAAQSPIDMQMRAGGVASPATDVSYQRATGTTTPQQSSFAPQRPVNVA